MLVLLCAPLHGARAEAFQGEWPSVWPEHGWKNWKPSLATTVPKLAQANAPSEVCRWQSGCLECDACKCFRHHLHSESAKAQKLPYLSIGPEDLEQLLKTSSAAPAISSSPAAL